MLSFQFRSGFGSATGPWSSITVLSPWSAPDGDYLLAGSQATGSLHLLSLRGTGASVLDSATLSLSNGAFALSDAALVSLVDTAGAVETRLYTVSRTGRDLDVHRVDGTGLTELPTIRSVGGVPMAVSSIEPIALGASTYLATAAHDGDSLQILRLSAGGGPSLVEQVRDDAKTPLSGVSDLLNLAIGGEAFLVTASALRDGVSTFHILPGGHAELADTLTAKDGLWVDGIDALAQTQSGGNSFVVAGSALAGLLAVIRVNALGVMFITDQVLDDLNTRFDNVSQIATASIGTRSFVIAGGNDGGITLMELLPDGKLFHHQSFVASGEASALTGGLTGLSVTARASTLDIFAGTPGGLVRLAVPLDALGQAIESDRPGQSLQGGNMDDLIFASFGGESLAGGAGDDILVAAASRCRMTGGGGADVFRLTEGVTGCQITDFQQNHDRIDLSDWGRLYDISALRIMPDATGATISWRDQSFHVAQADGQPIPSASWTMDDFLF